jgi:hypothetical protein
MSDIITWNITPEESWGRIAQSQVDGIEADIVALVDGMTEEVAAWMRVNHRWQNRTGAAEDGLYADIEHVVRQSVYLLMSHGPAVPYAWFLEFAQRGRFAVLPDAVDFFWPILYRGVVEIVRKWSS